MQTETDSDDPKIVRNNIDWQFTLRSGWLPAVVVCITVLVCVHGCSKKGEPTETGSTSIDSNNTTSKAVSSATAVASTEIKPGPSIASLLDKRATAIALPGPILDLCVAQNGRKLVVLCDGARKLVVVELPGGGIHGSIPLPDDRVCIAAGRSKLVVGFQGRSMIQRWDLETLTLELEVLVSGEDAPVALAMGCDSNGPILSVAASSTKMLLEETLMPLSPDPELQQFCRQYVTSQHRASPDGSLFCSWDYDTVIAGYNVLRVPGNIGRHTTSEGISGYSSGISVGHLLSTADNSLICTAHGTYDPSGAPQSVSSESDFRVPAIQGTVVASVKQGAGEHLVDVTLQSGERKCEMAGIEFIDASDLSIRAFFSKKLKSPLSPDRRMILLPMQKCMITVPATPSTLLLWPIDFESCFDEE